MFVLNDKNHKIQGAGLGLRFLHLDNIIETQPDIGWFEILADNFLSPGPQHQKLEEIRKHYPIVFHCVGMSLGSADGVSKEYLQKIKELKDRYSPLWVSDHLSWTSINNREHHDLLPQPLNKESLQTFKKNILFVQDHLKESLLVENASTYVSFKSSHYTECELVNALLESTDCYLLLDINNLYVNQFNHGSSALDFLTNVKADKIKQIHLAGADQWDDILFDTHGNPVHDEVWKLYNEALKIIGPVPTMIEWDNDIPSFEVLHSEYIKMKKILSEFL